MAVLISESHKWDSYMSINQKACDAIKENRTEQTGFTKTELYLIAELFGEEATILRRKMDGSNNN